MWMSCSSSNSHPVVLSVLFNGLCYHQYLFSCSIVPDLANKRPLRVSSGPSRQVLVIIWALPYFLVSHDVPGLSGISLAPTLEATTYPRNPLWFLAQNCTQRPRFGSWECSLLLGHHCVQMQLEHGTRECMYIYYAHVHVVSGRFIYTPLYQKIINSNCNSNITGMTLAFSLSVFITYSSSGEKPGLHHPQWMDYCLISPL